MYLRQCNILSRGGDTQGIVWKENNFHSFVLFYYYYFAFLTFPQMRGLEWWCNNNKNIEKWKKCVLAHLLCLVAWWGEMVLELYLGLEESWSGRPGARIGVENRFTISMYSGVFVFVSSSQTLWEFVFNSWNCLWCYFPLFIYVCSRPSSWFYLCISFHFVLSPPHEPGTYSQQMIWKCVKFLSFSLCMYCTTSFSIWNEVFLINFHCFVLKYLFIWCACVVPLPFFPSYIRLKPLNAMWCWTWPAIRKNVSVHLRHSHILFFSPLIRINYVCH